jgi:uncharacterized protein YycO
LRALLTAAVLAAGLLLAAPATEPPPGRALPPLPEMRSGDIVFLSAPGVFWADAASRWSDPVYRHGHVGVVEVRGGEVFVVHAKGDPTRSRARVTREPLALFLADARAVSVFRPTSARAAAVAAQVAEDHARRRTPFDGQFSLASADRLYCTELVWRALSAGYGRDVVPVKTAPFGHVAVRLSDLEHAPVLRLAWRRTLAAR